MSTTNFDAYDMKAIPTGKDGLIHEDLMDKIYSISPEVRPFCDAVKPQQNKPTQNGYAKH
jgi:hypothetical protein